jgi:hypothetical protein
MKKKKFEEMNLDEVISVAIGHATDLEFALSRVLMLRRKQRITKPRNAALLQKTLGDLADTAKRLSNKDYEDSLAKVDMKEAEEEARYQAFYEQFPHLKKK